MRFTVATSFPHFVNKFHNVVDGSGTPRDDRTQILKPLNSLKNRIDLALTPRLIQSLLLVAAKRPAHVSHPASGLIA